MSKFKARLHEKMEEAKMMPKLDLPVVIGRLQSLKRWDTDVYTRYECIHEVCIEECEDGEWVKSEDIKKLIEGLKKDNALRIDN